MSNLLDKASSSDVWFVPFVCGPTFMNNKFIILIVIRFPILPCNGGKSVNQGECVCVCVCTAHFATYRLLYSQVAAQYRHQINQHVSIKYRMCVFVCVYCMNECCADVWVTLHGFVFILVFSFSVLCILFVTIPTIYIYKFVHPDKSLISWRQVAIESVQYKYIVQNQTSTLKCINFIGARERAKMWIM